MPTSHRRRALALSGLVFLSPVFAFASAGWKTAALPFGKGLSIELPAEAKPGLIGKEWIAHGFASGAKLPAGSGFASVFPHKFDNNPLTLENYQPGVPLEDRLRDFAVAKCYVENEDTYSFCPRELMKVSSRKTKWGNVFVVTGEMRFRRGDPGGPAREAVMIAVPNGENEVVVIRSLGGEIKKRLLSSLGIEVKQQSFYLPVKRPPNPAALPPDSLPPPPSAEISAPNAPRMAPQIPPIYGED